jgi:hypothetical protein
MAVAYTNIFHFMTLQKFTQIGIFGLKIYHLAILFAILLTEQASTRYQI